MNNYWAPPIVDNPELENDLKTYFFQNYDNATIQDIIAQYKSEVTIICDRFEFITKLLALKKIFMKRKKYSNPFFHKKIINNEEVIEVSRNENIKLCRSEFNGITYDIDALCQYLLLTIIDTIMGKIEYENFTTWLKGYATQQKYSLAELEELQNKYDEENGLQKNFIKAFSNHLSDKLKNRITQTFILSKIDLGVINPDDYSKWVLLSDNDKYTRIVKHFYSKIRCLYTHSCSRTLLSDSHIMGRIPTKKKVLVATIDPKNDGLVQILIDVIKELVIEKYVNKKI